VSQGVVTYPVSLNIDARNQVLPSGLTASATITVDEKNDVLVVPLRAVRRQGREEVVDVVGSDGKPAARPVKTGVQNEQSVEITDGLQEGEQILVQGTTTRAPNAGVGVPGAPVPGPGRVLIGGPGR
jgi:HlyD family secretion protein